MILRKQKSKWFSQGECRFLNPQNDVFSKDEYAEKGAQYISTLKTWLTRRMILLGMISKEGGLLELFKKNP